MTQPTEAVGGEATPVEPTNPADVFTELAREEFGITDEQEEEPAEAPEGEEADDDLEIEEGDDELPPIDAPVSLTAEEKEAFKNLPREAQEFTARRIGELEKGFNSKAQEAARARQDAEQAALSQLAQVQATYAQEYQQFAASIRAQKPSPMLQVTDPVGYAQQMDAFERSEAQRGYAQQQAQQYAHQAQAYAQQVEQAQNAEQHRIIVEQFPEYADPTTGPKLRAELSSIAKDILGYPDELIAQARASDIIAMKRVSDIKAKADKYDALMSKKMSNVRAARGLPKVATPGVSQGATQLSARGATAAFEVAKSSKNRDVQGAAFFDYLSKTGQI